MHDVEFSDYLLPYVLLGFHVNDLILGSACRCESPSD